MKVCKLTTCMVLLLGVAQNFQAASGRAVEAVKPLATALYTGSTVALAHRLAYTDVVPAVESQVGVKYKTSADQQYKPYQQYKPVESYRQSPSMNSRQTIAPKAESFFGKNNNSAVQTGRPITLDMSLAHENSKPVEVFSQQDTSKKYLQILPDKAVSGVSAGDTKTQVSRLPRQSGLRFSISPEQEQLASHFSSKTSSENGINRPSVAEQKAGRSDQQTPEKVEARGVKNGAVQKLDVVSELVVASEIKKGELGVNAELQQNGSSHHELAPIADIAPIYNKDVEQGEIKSTDFFSASEHLVEEIAPHHERSQAHAVDLSFNPQLVSLKIKAPEAYDIQQQYIESSVKKTSSMVDNWVHEYSDATSNMYVQENLKDDILSSMLQKNSEGNLELINPEADAAVIEELLKKYKKHGDVQYVLGDILRGIHESIASQQVTPQQANSVIIRYYTSAMRDDIFAFIKTQPLFDSNGNITNMPSIEKIITAAQENPTQQALNVLQSALKATQIAEYAFRGDSSLFGNGPLLTQLKTFESNIAAALKNPRLEKFQSWGSYAESFIPTTREVLDVTGLGDVKLSTALSGGVKAVDLTHQSLQAIGVDVGEMTLSQVAAKAGLTSNASHDKLTVATEIIKPEQPLSKFDKMVVRDKAREQAKIKTEVNHAMVQFYTPAMKNDIALIIDSKVDIDPVTNMPSIDAIVQIAMDKPSQKAFNALQSVLEATRVAKFAAQLDSSILSQDPLLKPLNLQEAQLVKVLQDPRFTQFHSWSSRATSYAKSFIPSVKTILDTGGLGQLKVSDVATGIKSSLDLLKQAPYGEKIIDKMFNLNGVEPGDVTIYQALTKAGVVQNS